MKLFNCCLAALLCLCQLRAQTVGSLDPTFATDGILTIDDGDTDIFLNLLQDVDDQFLVVYAYSGDGNPVTSAIQKFSSDGILDTNFGTIGRVIFQYDDAWNAVRDAHILANGKILIGGDIGTSDRRGFFVRLNADGSLDQDFGVNGLIDDPIATPLARQEFFDIQSDGKVLTLYITNDSFPIYRFNTDGSIDDSFGDNGQILLPTMGTFPLTRKIKVLEDDSFVIHTIEEGSDGDDLIIIKFLPNGELDLNFGTDGEFRYSLGVNSTFPEDLVLQDDGKFLFIDKGLDTDVSLIRISADGTIDESFGTNGQLNLNIGNTGSVSSLDIFIESNNQFLLSGNIEEAGETRRVLSRYIDGELDTTLGEDGLLTLSFTGDPSVAGIFQIHPTLEEKFLIAGYTASNAAGTGYGNIVITRVFGDIDAAIGTPNQIDLGLKIMPNPVQDQLYFEFGLPEPTNLSASIFNARGQLLSIVISKERKVAGQHRMSCDVSHLPKGSYFLNLSTIEGEQSIQFIK